METREEVLKKINWDYTYTVEEINAILRGDDFRMKKPFYIKLLKSFRWYVLKDVLSKGEIEEMLSPDVINNLHIPSLKEKYKYVRQVLYG
ncbi:MAG: hypothetical protein K2U26_13580 [Cyclobacteriaceae bacterium]|nr:hypothetical protein [Cyclobacteriaceae bacterium]